MMKLTATEKAAELHEEYVTVIRQPNCTIPMILAAWERYQQQLQDAGIRATLWGYQYAK